MKIGVNLKINLSKLDKTRFFKGEKGTYLDITTFIDTENEGQYGDHGILSQSLSKDERERKVQLPIVGNAKVFYKADVQQQNQQQAPQQNQQQPQQQPGGFDDFDDDIPF
ncbi:MAG: hypothetical protein V3V84_07680 [Candidatus Bathyarchaeia archaeon]